ncbi:MAG: hypothetical protein U9Q38_06660, partial [Thermodesulfobacteriota bacterium]|nr:hypothetical protein [Thermodesulfobacteriota bacterium]
ERMPVEVKKGPLSLLKVAPTKQIVPSGTKVQFKVTGFDTGGNELSVKPTWSVPEDLGSIDDKGLFVAKKSGTGSVTVKSNDIKAAADIDVIAGKPASISVNPDKVKITAGDSVKLEVKVFDANENLIPRPECRWDIQGEIGDVTVNNLFSAHKAGKGGITIVSGKAFAKIPVEVNVGSVGTIRVSPETTVLNAGSYITFEARGYDNQGNEVELKPAWSVSGKIGAIGKKGKFEARITGHGNVACQMADIFGLSSVEVKPGAVKSIKVDPPEAALTAGESVIFGATAYDAYGNVCPVDFNWNLEADKSLGVFTAPGGFAPETAGEGKIVASVGKVRGYSKIKVKPSVLARVIVSPKNASLLSGENIQFKALGKDRFSNTISISPRWSVEPKELGKITPGGTFLAQKAGKGTLKATAEDFESSVTIEVKTGEPKYLSIDAPDSHIMAGKTYSFTALGYDQGGNGFPAEVKWAVTRDLGYIGKETGTFYATKVGKGTVVAYSGEIITDIPVEVKPGELRHLFIEPNTVTVVSNTKQEFIARGLDIEKNKVTLTSSAWNVAGGIGVFKKPGIFHGTRQGKGKVTASIGELRAEAYVTVVPGKPDSVNSRLRLTHTSLPADSDTQGDIIIEVRDTHNNLVPGIDVKLISDRQGDVIQQPAKTNQKGVAIGYISSTAPGVSTISAVIENISFRDTAIIIFK